MTDDQPELLASPSWDTDLEQSQEVFEELAVQLDLLSPCGFALTCRRARFPLCFAPYRGGFLLSYGIAHAIYEGDEEREVDGA